MLIYLPPPHIFANSMNFDVWKKRTKLHELGSGGGLGNSGNAQKKTVFFQLISSLRNKGNREEVMDNFIITIIWGLLQIWTHNNKQQGRWYQRKVEIRLYFEKGDFYSDYLYWWNTACLRVWRVFVVPWESGQWQSWLAIKGIKLCIHDDKDCLLVMLVQLLCCGHCCRVVQVTRTPERKFKLKPTLEALHEAINSFTSQI